MVAPHFMDDKDEDWMVHLPVEKKTYISDIRAEILSITEQIDKHTQAYRGLIISLRDADPARKAQAQKEYEDKKRSFEETRDETIRSILPPLRRLKNQGLAIKEQIARTEAEAFNKRRRIQDLLDPTVGLDPSVELVTDDYLPSYINSYLPQQSTANNQPKRKQKSHKNAAEELSNLRVNTPPKKNRDTFLDGVEDELVRKVLTELRSDIVKHNCRDRAIKAIQSIMVRDERINTMKSISQISLSFKCSTE